MNWELVINRYTAALISDISCTLETPCGGEGCVCEREREKGGLCTVFVITSYCVLSLSSMFSSYNYNSTLGLTCPRLI